MAVMQDTVTVMLDTPVNGTPAPVQIPRQIGYVRIGELLGKGASGAVFSAFDSALNRRVAVKVLHQFRGAARDAERLRLIEGVRSAARVKHPNIVAVHAVEAVGDIPVIVMEYVDGVTLRELLLKTGPVDVAMAVHIMRSIAAGVAALHDAQVVHRDLKPANILMDSDGQAHVCDFGLACDFSYSAFAAGANTIAGSPLYMAPETFDGFIAPQSDVYSLGIMLYEMLCGRPPFEAESMDAMKTCHTQMPVPLEPIERLHLPDGIGDVVERALHKQRIMRFKSAGHLLRALEQSGVTARRDEALRVIIADVLAARQAVKATSGESAPPEAPAATTYDLIAKRAAQKRGGKG